MPQWLTRVLPALVWLPRYQRENLPKDLAAGLTTAVMLIPQGMAYAMLAGLPPVIGLYASVGPLLAYAVLGTSRQLAVGPVAIDSLLVAQGVSVMAAGNPALYVELATMLSLMVAVIQIALGLVRAGFLVNFLSQPVVSGFTSAAALVIGASQLKHVLGLELQRSSGLFGTVRSAAIHIGDTHWPTLLIAALGMATLLIIKRIKRLFPAPLLVVSLSTLAVWMFGLDDAGVAIVGAIPAGLPELAVPRLDASMMSQLGATAFLIALVAFMEAISVGTFYARKDRYDLDANRELVALGAANLVGAFTHAYPVTGGFSRTAVNAEAGARTPLAGAVTAVAVAATLLWLTPLFYFLPKAVLAAIIMTAVFGLIDVAVVKRLWRVKRSDLIPLVVTFVATLGLGIAEGMGVGVATGLALFVYRTTRPHVALLGRIPGTEVYRNVKRFPHAQRTPGVLAVRVDAQFYFGNVNFLKDTLRQLEAAEAEPVKAVIIDANGVNQLDASAESALAIIADDYQKRGIRLILASVKGPVRDVLQRSGLAEALGPCGLVFRVHDAMVVLGFASTPAEVALPTAPDASAPQVLTGRVEGQN